mmetsp:Transcript_84645/g.267146  ORF Transcript_84645/g.267146 Transcript_84645/m.267146 type:complete len:228 (-) Transcript_84645:122-805(-)
MMELVGRCTCAGLSAPCAVRPLLDLAASARRSLGRTRELCGLPGLAGPPGLGTRCTRRRRVLRARRSRWLRTNTAAPTTPPVRCRGEQDTPRKTQRAAAPCKEGEFKGRDVDECSDDGKRRFDTTEEEVCEDEEGGSDDEPSEPGSDYFVPVLDSVEEWIHEALNDSGEEGVSIPYVVAMDLVDQLAEHGNQGVVVAYARCFECERDWLRFCELVDYLCERHNVGEY